MSGQQGQGKATYTCAITDFIVNCLVSLQSSKNISASKNPALCYTEV